MTEMSQRKIAMATHAQLKKGR